MNKLNISDVHPGIDGVYEFDVSEAFTSWEIHAIKKLTGLRPGEYEEAFAALDNDMIVAFGMIALLRAGKVGATAPWASEEVGALWNAPVGKIALDFSGEAEDGPPSQAPSDSDESDGASERNGSSGSASSPTSEIPEPDPSPTGELTSPISST